MSEAKQLHACAWVKAAKHAEDAMAYIRRCAEWPNSHLAYVDQMNGPPHSWEMDPRRPRASWICIHPVTGEIVGGGVDRPLAQRVEYESPPRFPVGIVTAMELCDAQLQAWGVVLLGEIRKKATA